MAGREVLRKAASLALLEGNSPRESMNKILGFVGATVGGYAGWWLGAHVGIMTAFIVSIIGTALGVYAGRQIARNYET
jgi:uncharacterized membrane protein YeaQ/YmgE (transglycosylase-associated protein family)